MTTGTGRVIARRAALVASAVFWIDAAAAQAQTGMIALDGELTPYLDRYKLSAVAAAVVRDGRVLAAGVAGTRRAGTDTARHAAGRLSVPTPRR